MDRNRANEAAEQLVETAWDSYKTFIGHTLALQQRNAKFVREMIDDSIEELRRQAESNRAMTRELFEIAEGQREAFRAFVEESVFDAYMDFLLFAPSPYSQERLQPRTSESAGSGRDGSLPLENYDGLTVKEVSEKLDDLSEQEIRIIRSYEKRHKNRETLLRQLDRKLARRDKGLS